MKPPLLLLFLLAACTSNPPQPARPTLNELYVKAHDAHFAALNKWLDAVSAYTSCVAAAAKAGNSDEVKACIKNQPDPSTYLPKDRREDETLTAYMERKQDDWEERACGFKAGLQARSIGEMSRIEDQCKRDVEAVRLRKAIEKLTKEKQK